MNDTRLAELREKYKNRNLLEELAWGIYADHSGYTTKQSGEFLNWLCNMAYRAIKAKPTAWVPVSERLPEPGLTVGNVTKYYLVQGEYGDMFVACYDGDKWEQIFNYDREIEEKVVAWMELPERYEPKEG